MNIKPLILIAINLAIVAAIILVGISPFLVSGIAGSIASANGCELHEGFANPCVIGGVDYGDDLYAMGVAGWLVFMTLPVAAILFALYVLVWLVIIAARIWRGRRKKKAESV
jgi:hypothetical protein